MIKNYNCGFIKQMVKQGGQLIDVRTPMEFSQGALAGAVNMPIEKFQQLTGDINNDKPVLLYCRTGARSGAVKNYLEQLGFRQVHNIGGIQQYMGC